MEEKVKVIQTSDTAKGTTIMFATDVAGAQIFFNDDHFISQIIIKMRK